MKFTGSRRLKAEDLTSLGFDFYIYNKVGTHGNHGGRIVCRQTKQSCPFNSFVWEKKRIIKFMDEQYQKQYGAIGYKDNWASKELT